MRTSTGKLSAAPDDHSDGMLADKAKRSDPAVVPVLVTLGARSGRHRTDDGKGADMAKRTRGPSPSDRVTRISGVKITPLARMVPVPPISRTA